MEDFVHVLWPYEYFIQVLPHLFTVLFIKLKKVKSFTGLVAHGAGAYLRFL